ncbi:MAG: hypothetical protein ACK4IK_06010 [Bacteroidia bacterium]
MTNQQKELALKKIEYFFTDNESVFIQLINAIKSAENKTIKCLLIANCIDMLAQYYSGDLKNNRTSKRFKELLIECGKISNETAELLYQFRNALNHHFGTFSYNHLANKKFRFEINSNINSLFEHRNNCIYVSDIMLEKFHLELCEKTFSLIKGNEKRMNNFLKVYKFIHLEK